MRAIAIALLLATLATPGDARSEEIAWPSEDGPEEDCLRVRVAYLYWYLRRLPVPPLLTTGPPGTTAVLGQPGTEVLYGGRRIESRHDRYIGFRLLADCWCDDEHTVGLSGSAFFLERDSSNRTYPWNSYSVLARPYVDATGTPRSFVVAGPANGGTLTGGFNSYSRMELFGQDLNAMWSLGRGDGWHLEGLAGVRCLQIRERLDLTGVSRLLPDQSELFGLTDHFSTFNKFFGGQVGLAGEYRLGRWSLEGKATVALGADHQEIRAKGDRVHHTPTFREIQDYGLYVLPSNRGSYDRWAFDMASEFSVALGFNLTEHIRASVGYNLILWNNPVRPGDQIQPINLSQFSPGGLVGPLTPTIPFKEDYFWAAGLTAGLEVTW